MKLNQYEILKQVLPDNICGQFISAVIVSDSSFTAAAKARGCRKVTKVAVQLSKKNFIETVNTSTGAVEVGVEFKAKRESYYEDEKLNGFFRHLTSKPEKKYVRLVWDEDKKNTVTSVYVDGDGNILGENMTDEKVKPLILPSAIKKATEGYGREKVMRAMDISVHELDVKVENVARLKICGQEIVDGDLSNYLAYVD